jgi:hypothetical protein
MRCPNSRRHFLYRTSIISRKINPRTPFDPLDGATTSQGRQSASIHVDRCHCSSQNGARLLPLIDTCRPHNHSQSCCSESTNFNWEECCQTSLRDNSSKDSHLNSLDRFSLELKMAKGMGLRIGCSF